MIVMRATIALASLLCFVFSSNAFGQASDKLYPIGVSNVFVVGNDEALGLDYFFTNPVASTAGPDGSLFVADRASMNIRMFDAVGVFVRAFGSRGQSPGEFMQLREVYTDNEKEILFAVDGLNKRITACDNTIR